MADSACDTENAILSLLALKRQEARDNPAGRIEEDLQFLDIRDEDIQALVDNELEPEEQQRLVDLLLFYPALHRRYEELKRQKSEIRRWWKIVERRH